VHLKFGLIKGVSLLEGGAVYGHIRGVENFPNFIENEEFKFEFLYNFIILI
jgi:hypothetical protein